MRTIPGTVLRSLSAVLTCLILATALVPAIPVRAGGASPSAGSDQAQGYGAVKLTEGTVYLPTYPYERYQIDAIDPQFAWPYKRFDYDRFRNDAPKPQLRSYRTIVLENEYLRLTILPELGGRIWRVQHIPSGNDLFYHNSTVMPSPWGPPNMRGWFGLGGLEWNLPVAEHGYTWGTPWDVDALSTNGQIGTVTLALPHDGRTLGATIELTLRAGEAAFTVTTTLTNMSQQPVRFAYWNSAALAPGKNDRPSADTHFVLPTDKVTVHSTDDKTLPGPSHSMPWPFINGRDMSWLGAWDQYLGIFEWPAAHGPFTGVYDRAQDAGGVRVFPAEIARGSKVFGLGWRDALDGAYFASDGSSYVELHGGLAPTFADQVALPVGGKLRWSETWYPVYGIGDLRYANENGAITWQPASSGLRVGFYPTHRVDGALVIRAGKKELVREPLRAGPNAPYNRIVAIDDLSLAKGAAPLTLVIEDGNGVPLLVAQ